MTPLERALAQPRCMFAGTTLCGRTLDGSRRLPGCTALSREECMTVLLALAMHDARLTVARRWRRENAPVCGDPRCKYKIRYWCSTTNYEQCLLAMLLEQKQ